MHVSLMHADPLPHFLLLQVFPKDTSPRQSYRLKADRFYLVNNIPHLPHIEYIIYSTLLAVMMMAPGPSSWPPLSGCGQQSLSALFIAAFM